MDAKNGYEYLGPRQGSLYRQFFLKGTRTRAETIYRSVGGEGGMTPEEVADDRSIPLEAVLECIHYCEHNEDLLRQERDEDSADMKARGLDKPPLVPPDYEPE